MRLFDRQGYGLALEILGYEFPELEDVPYDSNWLQVRLDVRYPEGHWQGIDPCLLTYEASQLADWLEAVAQDRGPHVEMRFFEPLIGFRLAGPARLQVEFWHPQENRDIAFDLALDALDPARAAEALRDALRPFPQRTAR